MIKGRPPEAPAGGSRIGGVLILDSRWGEAERHPEG